MPPAFVLTTEAYRRWSACPDDGLIEELIDEGLRSLEQRTGRTLGSPGGLVVSVRSGAPVSMPGMMDTVLNAGLGRVTAETDAFLCEARVRFLRQYAELVLGLDANVVDAMVAEHAGQGVDPAMLTALESALEAAATVAGKPWPGTPRQELAGAARAVFGSWQSPRAKLYRRMRKIDDALGTSVTIQQMVFGNRDRDSGSGVAFSRDPTSGNPGLTGEFLFLGQGEEVVAGKETGAGLAGWKSAQPQQFAKLEALGQTLEDTTGKVHEIEFTVESGAFFVLQCRPALLTARGAARVAVEMVDEGRLSRQAALDYAVVHGFDPQGDAVGLAVDSAAQALVQGLPVGGGVARGRLAMNPAAAEQFMQAGDPVVFATVETSPTLLSVMQRCTALVTMRGGATSHAAVVARQLGTPCVVGIGATIEADTLQIGKGLRQGDWVTVDGDSGRIYRGDAAVSVSRLSGPELQLRQWAADFQSTGDINDANPRWPQEHYS